MFSSIFSAYSGMLSFSKGLNVLSNNVSNMNTPGFKSSDVTFRDLFYQFSTSGSPNDGGQSQVGEGTDVSGTRINFAQGQLASTGNLLDAAISGNGFFVLHDGANTYYTRNGQFDLNANGVLEDKSSGAHVQATSGGGDLHDINLAGLQTSAATPTTKVNLAGNLSSGATTDQITSVTVYDSVGASHTWSLTFTNNSTTTAGSWLVVVQDENQKTIANGEIRFSSDGSPATGFNTMAFSFAPSGALPSKVTLNFGDAGSLTGATNFSGGTTSTLKVNTQNGYASGSLVSTSFDAQGFITLKYSNAQTVKGPQLALAWFNDLQQLQQLGNETFVNVTGMMPLLGTADGKVMGTLTAQDVERSNVDLTQQFTDLVIIQRGYQSSSQVISVANQMIQQLMDMRSGK
jgi:flagellar hook protein FlgE